MNAERSNAGAQGRRTADDGGGRAPSLDATHPTHAAAEEADTDADGAGVDAMASAGTSGKTTTAGVAVARPTAGVMAALAGSGGAAPSA